MIGISLARVFRAALKNLVRNVWLSVATTVVMTITLLMISFLYFANIFGANVLQHIESKVDLSVSFKPDVQDEYVQAVAEQIRTLPDVASVEVVTSAQALENFRQRNQDKPFIEESLRELDDNPLPASIYIVASDPSRYESIARQLQTETYTPFVEQVNYEDSKAVINSLINLLANVKTVSLIVTSVFALLVILIMYNTVRLAIYSYREEIDIMHLVGASRWFIQGPFVVEAVTVALLAVLISSLIIFPSLRIASPQLQRFFFDAQGQQFDIAVYATDHWFTVIGLQLVAAISLAVVSSLIAVRRYLRR